MGIVEHVTTWAAPQTAERTRLVLTRGVRTLVSAKVTATLLLVLLMTTIWLNHVADPDLILRHASTNVANLKHTPIRALFASALIVSGGGWLLAAIELAISFGRIERSRGAFTAVKVFASGHVIATVLTEGSVWIGIRAGLLPHSELFQIDVGISYGMFACLTAAIVLLPRRWRTASLAVVAAVVLVPLAVDHDMTSWGHLSSVLIGLAWWPTLSRPRSTNGSTGARGLLARARGSVRMPAPLLPRREAVTLPA